MAGNEKGEKLNNVSTSTFPPYRCRTVVPKSHVKTVDNRTTLENNGWFVSDSDSLSHPDPPSVEAKESPVKSTAVVKFSAIDSPAAFSRLDQDTKLNRPPSNWLSDAKPVTWSGESFHTLVVDRGNLAIVAKNLLYNLG